MAAGTIGHRAATGSVLALALLRRPTQLTKTESRYWDHLLGEQAAGRILEFRAHQVTLILGPDVRYTADFFVVLPSREMQVHEVKGPYIRSGDDGMVKLRTAAAQFPWFRFIRAQEGRDLRWTFKEIVP